MRLENSFDVPAPAAEAWSLLNDVPRIVPCMPGTELTETIDTDTWKAKMHVRLGPIALQFLVELRREQADAAARRTLLRASARELRGRGGARATIESNMQESNGGTRVAVAIDLTLQGPVAQYGRGIVAQVAEQLTSEFADCLARQLHAGAP
jgi:carbon monoxide dehydrogenase subunit G